MCRLDSTVNVSNHGARPERATIMRKLCGVLPCIALLSLGCADVRRDAERTQAQRQVVRDKINVDMQSIVGKRVVDISGPEKPVCITMDDGTQVVFDCHKYQMKVKVSKP